MGGGLGNGWAWNALRWISGGAEEEGSLKKKKERKK